MKKEIIIPSTLLFLALLSSVWVSYFQIQSNWVVVLFPPDRKSIFEKVFPFVDAVSEVVQEKGRVTVLVSREDQLEALREQKGIILDPGGIPLCARKTNI